MYESLVLFSEVILSAYPILIKKVNSSVFLQTGFRMTTFTICAMLLALWSGSPLLGSAKEFWAAGLLNFAHVGASYTAFEALPAGNAMSLFYTYPIWNLLAAAWAFGESIPFSTLPWMGLALLGTILVAQPTPTNWSAVGVVAALLAALTETGIYLWFRWNADTNTQESKDADTQPWTKMGTMYGGSAAIWTLLAIGLLLVGSTSLFRATSSGISKMLLFNILIGFVGYGIRFFAIPRVSTVIFSVLSFVGVLAAYLLGWIFVGETPQWIQGLGAAAIIVANSVLINKETV